MLEGTEFGLNTLSCISVDSAVGLFGIICIAK